MIEALGFSADEVRLYTLLIENPRSVVIDLAEYCDLSPQQVSHVLRRLVRRGLATRLPGRPARYVAVAPDVAIDPLITQHEDQLSRVRAVSHELMDAFREASRQSHPAELIEIITGAETIVARFRRLSETARTRCRAFDTPPYTHTDFAASEAIERQALTAGVEYRTIYSTAALTIPGRLTGDIRAGCEHGEQARVRPTLPLKLVIFDERTALVPIRTGYHRVDAALLVHPCALLDALIALFEHEWLQAKPLPIHLGEATDTPTNNQPNEIIAGLLSCLAAGLTDEGIARALGCSQRTAQRHTQRLMHELNATSRFQAGMEAQRRGWLG